MPKKKKEPEDPIEVLEFSIMDIPADSDAVNHLRSLGCKIEFRFSKLCEVSWPLDDMRLDMWPPADNVDPDLDFYKDYDAT